MSVRLHYRYRDASNYKAQAVTTIAGDWSDDEVTRFRAAIATAARGAGVDPTTFSPVDLDLPPAQQVLWEQFDRSDDDHIYNELLEIEQTTDRPDVIGLNAAELLVRAERVAREGYDVTRAMDVIGIDA
jgi:anthranilate phosphoribosyltransferase